MQASTQAKPIGTGIPGSNGSSKKLDLLDCCGRTSSFGSSQPLDAGGHSIYDMNQLDGCKQT